MIKIIATTKDNKWFGPEEHILECSICGENDRRKLIIEDIGISIGMSVTDYTFCKKCWSSDKLGKNLLKMLGHKKLKYIDDRLTLKKVKI